MWEQRLLGSGAAARRRRGFVAGRCCRRFVIVEWAGVGGIGIDRLVAVGNSGWLMVDMR